MVSACRRALQEEADVLCLLAKVDRAGLSFGGAASTPQTESDDRDGSITVVVQEGLEVLLPMAGTHCNGTLCVHTIAATRQA